jgi:hypothetical protein
MLSSRLNYEIQLMAKIIIMCLSPNVFIKFGVERLNTERWKVEVFLGIKCCLVRPLFC